VIYSRRWIERLCERLILSVPLVMLSEGAIMTTVIVAGIGGWLAQMVAGALAGQAGVRVVGVDRAPAEPSLPGIDVRISNLRGQALLELLREVAPDVVVHLAQFGEERAAPGREAAVRGNVIATMELLGACAAAGVRRVVLRSSTLVYGARHDLPALIVEAAPLRMPARSGLTRDYVEIERFAADFGLKRPDLSIVALRCAGLAGGGVSSPLSRYLGQPAPRTLLGFDPRIQVLHPADAAVAFALAALADGVSGAFNIAAEGPLTLTKAILLAGRRPLPLPGPLFGAAGLLGGGAGLTGELPFDTDFLRYSCVADMGRAREELGWLSQHSADEALRELAPEGELAVNA
jgi:UDP-glucose 4-epimerase